MGEMMVFPQDILQFIKDYEFKDKKKVYTNGAMLIPSFRVEQLVDYYFTELQEYKKLGTVEELKELIKNKNK